MGSNAFCNCHLADAHGMTYTGGRPDCPAHGIGVTRVLMITNSHICPICKGSGRVRDPYPGELVDVDTQESPHE